MSVGKNIPHDSGMGHVTGESVFIDDRAPYPNEVFVGIVTSGIAKGLLKKIDSKLALEHKDCLGVLTAKDLVGNKWGTIVHEQPLLVDLDQMIQYKDEPLALVVSCNRFKLQEIIKLVQCEYEEQTGIFSIEKAKLEKSTIATAHPFIRGDVTKALKSSPHTIKGVFECGGQEHFYMESQAAIAYPMEGGQIEVHASSQHPSETQRVVSEALGISLHQVVCVVKRMGGGFGGKESQAAPIAAYAAFVAQKFKRAARLVLTKDEDMKITGKRHPFKNEYEIGFDNVGKFLALRVWIQSDGGAYADLSASILERAMFHVDGAYYFENVEVHGTCYRTNNHPNTAFRGFGGPQGNMTIESAIEEVASFLGKDAYEIRRINCYEKGRDITPYGQLVENNMLPALFEKLHHSSHYQARLQKVIEFNQKKRGKLRGLSMTATKFGIAFTARFLNQGNALVNLHLDGTLQVSTGATEMGQGVNTKIAQIVAHAFGIPTHHVQVMQTSTEKNHNTSPTAASSGSDINGAAALKACEQIKARLSSLAYQYFKQAGELDPLVDLEVEAKLVDDITFENEQVFSKKFNKSIGFEELVRLAYMQRISLGEYAHFKTTGLSFDPKKGKGNPFNYFTQGVALSEIEIDEYTGELKVLSCEILMDLGRPINPGVDYGQVTGGFVQGMGWVTTENLFYDDKRSLLSHSPTTYKIPNIHDTPRNFKVEFIENHDNTCNVHRSKAVGEPPLLLGTSVWTAVKHALSFRNKIKDNIQLTSPATPEVILKELTRLKYGTELA